MSKSEKMREAFNTILSEKPDVLPNKNAVYEYIRTHYPGTNLNHDTAWYSFKNKNKKHFDSVPPSPIPDSTSQDKKPKKWEKILETFRDNIGLLKKDVLKENLKKELTGIWKHFGGPSVHFHKRAIEKARKDETFLRNDHLEMIYAVLPAWGMHRMGMTKTKIVKWKKFKDAILDGKEMEKEIRAYKREEQKKTFETVDSRDIASLILKLKISVSDARLVSASKALHHILPNLVPPIDRAYSIRFMQQKKEKFNRKSISIDVKYERWYAKAFIKEMQSFINDPEIKVFLKMKRNQNEPPYNVSIPKVLDNLIIAFVRKYTPLKKKTKR